MSKQTANMLEVESLGDLSKSETEVRLDENARYSKRSILRSERVYGRGFQSPGGLLTAKIFAESLRLAETPDLKVLDLGCGMGGGALYLAATYRCMVKGLDYSQEMIDLCNERLEESKLPQVTFRQGDGCDLALFPPETFDLVWSRDAILHMEQKNVVFANLHRWLKPGGRLFLTDFGKGPEPQGESFKAYVQKAGYHLQTFNGYHATLLEAGFNEVERDDVTSLFNELNHNDLEGFLNRRADFVDNFSASEFEHLEQRWRLKIKFGESNQLKWFKFKASKSY